MNMLELSVVRGCGCGDPEHSRSLIGIDEALARIAAASPIAGTEEVELAASVGRILAASVRAAAMAPPFDNAAMDGYAVHSAALSGQGPWTLACDARIPAGRAPERPLAGLCAARIFTGAPIPPGADAVVMQEEVERRGDAIRIFRRPPPGLNIRRAGDDMRAGQIVLESGRRLGPRDIAAAAAAGTRRLIVRRRLRVALLVTGDEVRRPGATRDAAQIWDVDTPMLAAALAQPAIDLVVTDGSPDDCGELAGRLAGLARRVDLVVTTGGVSVGEEDHVKPALAGLGVETIFSGVAIKPGKPVSVGRLGATFWIGLPGNPLSAFVTWRLFGEALARRLTGQDAPGPARRNVVTARSIHRKPGRCELRPATLAGFDAQGREVVTFEDATHSGRVALLPQADGLIFLPAEADHLAPGALVEFQPFCDH